MKRKIAILGATGSVGGQSVEVARANKDAVELTLLTANENTEKLCRFANEFKPKCIACEGTEDRGALKRRLDYAPEIFCGRGAVIKALKNCECDMVMLAIVGIAGLPVFDYCVENHISVALANKESLVCGGDIMLEKIRRGGIELLPVDSEHSAIYQCLGESYNTDNVKNIIITASGGPFFGKTRAELESITPEMAVKHPKWSMGQKISIDSATLVNKGLEVIEAHYLFDMPPERIKVLVHPQSIVHSMIERADSSIIAQLGPVDMRLPIQKALLKSEKAPFTLSKPLDLAEIARLEFFEPDMETFSGLALAYETLKAGGCAPAVYNIANEEAVALFIKGAIGFLRISAVIEECLERFSHIKCDCTGDILHINEMVRDYIIKRYCV